LKTEQHIYSSLFIVVLSNIWRRYRYGMDSSLLTRFFTDNTVYQCLENLHHSATDRLLAQTSNSRKDRTDIASCQSCHRY